MPLVPTSAKLAKLNANPSTFRTVRGWVIISQFAFCPDKVDGFLRVPEHMVGDSPVPDITVVFFGGHRAEVRDPEGELFQYLAKYRELQCE
ncbi:MAG: hypothetical protein LBH01_02350 [Verrucomicrobiales bacterium]|jgi:hypothetical protein|nr:hypothetical protein [Verrucomicrobiales bacterium]